MYEAPTPGTAFAPVMNQPYMTQLAGGVPPRRRSVIWLFIAVIVEVVAAGGAFGLFLGVIPFVMWRRSNRGSRRGLPPGQATLQF